MENLIKNRLKTYYPIPYEDEILYSQIARLFDHALEHNVSRGLRRLFGDGNYKATIDLPNRLTTLFNTHYYQLESSVDQIITKYTLYPFYEPFLKNDKRSRILDSLKNGPGSLIHIIAGINSSKVRRKRYPRYCPCCIAEARTLFHESYWRRVHQIPGVLVCPIHNVFLKEYKPSVDQLNQSMFIAAERVLDRSISSTENRYNTLLMMSKLLDDVLNHRVDFDINIVDYKERIRNSPYIKGANINYSMLIDDAIKYYGVDALTAYFPELTHPLQWVPSVVRRPLTYFDPVKHLLLFNFLNNMECEPKLFNDPIWDGPWKCLNGACKNYGKFHIRVANVFYDNRLKRKAALINCDCGMVYKTSFILRNDTKVQTLTIKDYGGLWRAKVLMLHGTGKSINSIARMLHVDFRTISRFVSPDSESASKIKDLKFQNELVIKRREWKELLESFEDSKIINARNENNRLYKWLYNNDLSWLKITNRLYASKPIPLKLKLDWKKIDDELVSKIADALEELQQRKFNGRITKSLISKLINREKNYIKVNGEKLPNVNILLKQVIEPSETYQLRRLRASINELKERSESLTMSKVIRNSKLKSVTDRQVLKCLEDEIRRHQFA